MIYPKFSQRYLAVIVVCLILTFSALGAVFLIYLFNAGSSTLALTSGGNGGLTILKSASSLIEGGIVQQQQEKRNFQQERIVTKNSNENNDNNSEIPYENYELDDNIDDSDDDDGANNYVHQKQLKQQEKRQFMNNMKYKLYSITSTVKKQKKAKGHQHNNNNNSAEDEINLEMSSYTKDIIDEKGDISVSATSAEILRQLQNQNGAGSKDNFDTIYIDDFERINNNMHVNKVHEQAKLISGVNEVVNTERSYINYFDAAVSNDDADGNIDIMNDKQIDNRYVQDDVTTEASYRTATTAATSSPATDIAVVLAPTELLVIHKVHKEVLKRDRQHTPKQQKHDGKSNKKYNSRRQHQQQIFKQMLDIKRMQAEDNLDALYDNANYNYDVIEDDDDDDDDKLFNGASGSGDFDTTNCKQNMKSNFNFQPNARPDNVAEIYDGDIQDGFDDVVAADAEPPSFIKRISFKMFQRMGGKNSSKNRRDPKIKYFKTKNQTEGDKQRRVNTNIEQQQQKSHTKNHNKRIAKKLDINKNSTQEQRMSSLSNHNYNFITSNLSASHLFESEKLLNRITGAYPTSAQPIVTNPVETTTTVKFALNNNSKNVSKFSMLFTTPAASTAAKNLLPFSAATLAKDKKEQQPQQVVSINAASADMPTIGGGLGGGSHTNSAAWSETRTRRIIGNVRKSEERSRQLLLCEEAGGGELCRMLFKGHLSE